MATGCGWRLSERLTTQCSGATCEPMPEHAGVDLSTASGYCDKRVMQVLPLDQGRLFDGLASRGWSEAESDVPCGSTAVKLPSTGSALRRRFMVPAGSPAPSRTRALRAVSDHCSKLCSRGDGFGRPAT